MLDVHPPHEKIHGVRDFLVHLLTITVGLLIALGLEASVEALHHRHQREHAEAVLRQELSENKKTLQEIQTENRKEKVIFQKLLSGLSSLKDGTMTGALPSDLNYNTQPLESAAWRTASATGALSYMSYEEEQRFETAYEFQQGYETVVAESFRPFEVLYTYDWDHADPHTWKSGEIDARMEVVRECLAALGSSWDYGRGVSAVYDDALKQ